ncbi:hypothetical protein [Paracoccus sp. (in: a-proteobacteria)]|uniref:hypothetical protein n=1 Tax=Paracoccus sp. TaxID=267 RepID=UPI00396CDF36
MSHNHEPERAARRHKPALTALAFVLAVALVAFFVFRPGVNEQNEGIATTPPPEGTTLEEATATTEPDRSPATSAADTPLTGTDAPAGTADPAAGDDTPPAPAVN